MCYGVMIISDEAPYAGVGLMPIDLLADEIPFFQDETDSSTDRHLKNVTILLELLSRRHKTVGKGRNGSIDLQIDCQYHGVDVDVSRDIADTIDTCIGLNWTAHLTDPAPAWGWGGGAD